MEEIEVFERQWFVRMIVTRIFVGEAAHTETVVDVMGEVVLVGKTVLVAIIVKSLEEVVITAGFLFWIATAAKTSLSRQNVRTVRSANCMLI
jgi:hypothetical protein